jgi:hypothetical protein
MEGLPSHKQMILLFDSLHVSAQIGHHQVFLEEYTNGGGIHINCSADIKFCLLKLRRIRLNTVYSLDSKIKIRHTRIKFKNETKTVQGDHYKVLFLDVFRSRPDDGEIFRLFILQSSCITIANT